jgi:type I restriction-modification system DNA methylase subunit
LRVLAHQGQKTDIAIYGQERNHTTFGLARMNLAIRGIFADLRWNSEGTLVKDAFPDERFDFILANAQGVKAERSNHRVLPKGRFTILGSVSSLFDALFGP